MSQFPIKVIVLNVSHSWMEHLKDEWLPAWATVSTDDQTVAVIKKKLMRWQKPTVFLALSLPWPLRISRWSSLLAGMNPSQSKVVFSPSQ